MTTEQLKQTIDGLTDEERIFAAAYLKAQSLVKNPAWVGEIQRRKSEMDQGHNLSADSVKELHQGLTERGL